MVARIETPQIRGYTVASEEDYSESFQLDAGGSQYFHFNSTAKGQYLTIRNVNSENWAISHVITYFKYKYSTYKNMYCLFIQLYYIYNGTILESCPDGFVPNYDVNKYNLLVRIATRDITLWCVTCK